MKIDSMLAGISDPQRKQYWARGTWGHRCYVYKSGDIITYSSNGYDSAWVIPHPDMFAEDWEEVIPHP